MTLLIMEKRSDQMFKLMYNAISAGNVTEIIKLLQSGIDVNTTNSKGEETLLCIAAKIRKR